jgi:hypothetical protein
MAVPGADRSRVPAPAAFVASRARTVVLMLGVVALATTDGAAGRDAPGGGGRAPRFADYPAGAAFRGAPAPPDFARNPGADAFATELREGVRRGPNFAGYLRVVEWSCGTSCRRWMVVNTKTGRIHDSPEPAFSLEYQLNSRLLVVNTVGRFTAADPPAGVPIAKYYVWRNDRLQLVDVRAPRGARATPR